MSLVARALHELIISDAHNLNRANWREFLASNGSVEPAIISLASFEELWPDWPNREAADGKLLYDADAITPTYRYWLRNECVSFSAKPLESYKKLYALQRAARREARAIAGATRRSTARPTARKRVAL
jgi:hypothetical protein